MFLLAGRGGEEKRRQGVVSYGIRGWWGGGDVRVQMIDYDASQEGGAHASWFAPAAAIGGVHQWKPRFAEDSYGPTPHLAAAVARSYSFFIYAQSSSLLMIDMWKILPFCSGCVTRGGRQLLCRRSPDLTVRARWN